MEWEEIYGTNPSRVLKTLAGAAATSSSFSPLPCSPLLLHPLSNQNPERGRRASQSGTSPKAERHITFGPSVGLQLLLETTRTWTPLTPCGGFWRSLSETALLNDNLYKHQKLIYSLIDLPAVIYALQC